MSTLASGQRLSSGSWRTLAWVAAIVLRASLASPAASAQDANPAVNAAADESDLGGDEEAVVVGDEPVVSGDDQGVVGEFETASADRFNAKAIAPRVIDDQPVYLRQTAEAYVDPDVPRDLDLKYYFRLAGQVLTVGQLVEGDERHRLLKVPRGSELVTIEATAEAAAAPADRLPLEVQWLDYRTHQGPTRVVLLEAQAKDRATLSVHEIVPAPPGYRVDRSQDSRELIPAQLPAVYLPGGLLAVWDRPAEIPGAVKFFARVIAVLKQVEGRFAVDFYGERLHEDSDCRVWLTPLDHPWGRAVAIRFVDLPVRREAGNVEPVSALGVVYRNDAGATTEIAIEFPLGSTPQLAQMRRLSSLLPRGGRGRGAPPPDVRKLLGTYVSEELERRLVAATYH